MLLYSRKKVRYRRDGYCWKKRKDGKTTREDHMKLKVQGTEVTHYSGSSVTNCLATRTKLTMGLGKVHFITKNICSFYEFFRLLARFRFFGTRSYFLIFPCLVQFLKSTEQYISYFKQNSKYSQNCSWQTVFNHNTLGGGNFVITLNSHVLMTFNDRDYPFKIEAKEANL